MKPQEIDMTIKKKHPVVNVLGFRTWQVIDAVIITHDRQNFRAPKCPRLVMNRIVTS